LTVALRTVTNESEGVVLEVVMKLLSWPVLTLIDILLDTSEVNGLLASALLLHTSAHSNLWCRTHSVGGSNEASSLHSWLLSSLLDGGTQGARCGS